MFRLESGTKSSAETCVKNAIGIHVQETAELILKALSEVLNVAGDYDLDLQ